MYYDRSVNFHAVLGLWDLEGFEILEKAILALGLLKTEKTVVADVGANIGFVSLWFSKLLQKRGLIYAFESAPRALSILKKNLLTNHIFVKTTTLDDFFLRQGKKGPKLIGMDIEGSGICPLRGCDGCIEKYRPLFWIESHMPEEDRAISNILVTHGYSAFRAQTRTWVKEPHEIHPHRDGVWGTLLLCPPELLSRLEEAL